MDPRRDMQGSASVPRTALLLLLATVPRCSGGHCTLSTVPNYCCSIPCDTDFDLTLYNVAQPTCSNPFYNAARSDIFAIASGCGPLTEGSCSWDASADAKCISQGLCPAAVPPATIGCVPGLIAGEPLAPPPPPQPPAVVTVAGDPFTTIDGVDVRFSLPAGNLTRVYEEPPFTIYWRAGNPLIEAGTSGDWVLEMEVRATTGVAFEPVNIKARPLAVVFVTLFTRLPFCVRAF